MSDRAATTSASIEGGKKCLAIVDKLSSEVFNSDFPPVDWADMSLLGPHEAIRRQMTMMTRSVRAIPDDPAEDELWKVTLFARWYTEYFFVSVEEHHDAEEKIYFPWIKSKSEYPEGEFHASHESLSSEMKGMRVACETIRMRQGRGCEDEIALLKDVVPAFERNMLAHLREEEETIPELLRKNFTREEEGEVVGRIAQAGGLTLTERFFPAILLAMREWAASDFYDELLASMPPPVRELVFEQYLPNFENVVVPMRDAPTLEEKPASTVSIMDG
ncbi:hypothetical protein ACHAXA_005343 [Cyclostephanos tholiformis]|uniref:Hemerythrin-like domain-containing protein n=1 Tax=Cyclostephanos tholiformis TaxID=382380 RepID=A0ABD3R7L8_9STRA